MIASAAGMSSRETRFGTIAVRATFCSAPKPASRPPSTYSRSTGGSPISAAAHSAAGQRDERDLVEQQQPAAVHAVGERPADERHQDQRPELGRAEQAGQQRRVRLRVDLKRQRDERGLRPEARDEVAQHEQPQLARGAQRAEVRRQL